MVFCTIKFLNLKKMRNPNIKFSRHKTFRKLTRIKHNNILSFRDKKTAILNAKFVVLGCKNDKLSTKKHVNINKSAKKQQKKLFTSAKQNKMKNNYLRIALR